jgi:type II secretory pathway pseudopilin PulG
MARITSAGRPCNPRRTEGGFSYLLLLLWVAISGVGLAALGTSWATARQHDDEIQLLYNGHQYRLAIGRYYLSGGANPRYPPSLDDLLKDPRTPAIQRHLRRPLLDPMTGEANWDLIRAADGGIMGVRSTSTQRPRKTANFDGPHRVFEQLAETRAEKLAYADWEFVYLPPRPSPILTPQRR